MAGNPFKDGYNVVQCGTMWWHFFLHFDGTRPLKRLGKKKQLACNTMASHGPDEGAVASVVPKAVGFVSNEEAGTRRMPTLIVEVKKKNMADDNSATVITVNNKDNSAYSNVIVSPKGSYPVPSTNIPNSKVNVFILHRLNIETNCWDGRNYIPQFELVHHSRLAGKIKSGHHNSNLSFPKDFLEG
eukprot:TRINITY_DN8814_c0_g1_i4.p1 TRINITY_DN8814_c0_g1~~TRINITY_DN8814_c0_g1_i4.p1  ORF type:complete len:186 (-),score=16.62 TRINITY_DN8814_c0_g1_i4:56-613(-)